MTIFELPAVALVLVLISFNIFAGYSSYGVFQRTRLPLRRPPHSLDTDPDLASSPCPKTKRGRHPTLHGNRPGFERDRRARMHPRGVRGAPRAAAGPFPAGAEREQETRGGAPDYPGAEKTDPAPDRQHQEDDPGVGGGGAVRVVARWPSASRWYS